MSFPNRHYHLLVPVKLKLPTRSRMFQQEIETSSKRIRPKSQGHKSKKDLQPKEKKKTVKTISLELFLYHKRTIPVSSTSEHRRLLPDGTNLPRLLIQNI